MTNSIRVRRRFGDAPEPAVHEWVAKALYNKGVTLGKLNQDKEAIAVYDEVVRRFGDVPEPAVREWVASALVNKGWTIGVLNRSDDAIAVYDEMVRRFGEAPEPAVREPVAGALYNKGNALSVQKKYDEAIENYQEAIKYDANFAYAHHNIAHYLWQQGKYKEGLEAWNNARKVYEETLQKARDAKNVDNFLYYGSVLHEVFHELNNAEEIYKEGLEFDPNNINILTGLVNLYLEKKDEVGDERTTSYWKARENYLKAKGILEDLLKKVEDASTLLQFGNLCLTMEDYTEAETHLLKALKKDKESSKIYASLGVLYARKEKFKRAVQYFDAALRRDPDDLTVWSSLAEAYLKANQKEKAEAEYKKILGITQNHVESHIGLGEVYTAMGDAGDGDMYAQSISHFTEGKRIAESGEGSKKLKKKELAAILYSRGYARVKYYESLPIRDKDENQLYNALKDFKECSSIDKDHHKAKRAKEKLEKRLSSFTPQRLMEKAGPWIIFSFSLIVFIFSQCKFFFDIPTISNNITKVSSTDNNTKLSPSGDNAKASSTDVIGRINTGYYVTLTFGSLIFMVAGLSLPQILKLKVGGIEMQKSSIDQITTSTSLGISK